MQTQSPQPQDDSGPGLRRALGPGVALAIVVGNVIGSGIFLKPGSIAAEAGDFRLILAAWLLGGAVCVLGALCFAELAAMLPRAGGLYAYLKEAYGKPAAFLFSWNEFLFNRPASIGALSVAFAGALGLSLGRTLNQLETILLALGLILLLTWVNIRGVHWGGWVQGATTLVKASFLGLLALLPFLMTPFSETGIDWANYSSRVEPSGDLVPGTRFGLVLLSVMWAYNGWHGITPVAEEVRNPERNIPRAMFGGVGLLTVLYVSANLAYHGVLSLEEMAAAGPHAAETMVAALLGPSGATVMAAVIMCSTFGAINSNLLLATRIPFALGRDRILSARLGRVHAVYRTPFVAITVQALMAALLVLVSGLLIEFLGWSGEKTIFQILTDFIIFGNSIFYMLGAAALFILRRKRPDWNRPYRTWGYPVVPLLYLGFYVWFLTQVYLGKPFEASAGVVLIGTGVPVYWIWRRWR